MYSTVGSRGPSTGRTQVSSQTSRTAVSRMCSSGSLLPLGSDQSSYLGRCTSKTSAAPPPPDPWGLWDASDAGRQIAAPAARVVSVICRTDPPFPDQGLLHVAQRIPGLVPAVPYPVAVHAQPPRGSPVVHAHIKEPAQPPLVAEVVDPDQQFYPAVQIPVHHIGAADPDLAVLVLAGAEREDAGMLEEPAEHAADPDGVGEPRDSRPQRADAAHPQVARDARLGRPIERVDHHLVDQRVGLEHDPGRLAGPSPLRLPVDPADNAGTQRFRRYEQSLVRPGAAVPGQVVEQGGDVLA